MKSVKVIDYSIYTSELEDFNIDNDNKIIINTINAHSYIMAKNDALFKQALLKSDILLPDGEGIVLMAKKLENQKIKKIAGADIHKRLLEMAQEKHLKCFYLGASDTTLQLIKDKLGNMYNKVKFSSYSPPFKAEFSAVDNATMVDRVNTFKPDILFVGMTAPKQEKWVHDHKDAIDAKVICSIGAVFDFIAETQKRAPQWVIAIKMEWLYRSFTSWRLAKRYIYSTPLFLMEVYKIKFLKK